MPSHQERVQRNNPPAPMTMRSDGDGFIYTDMYGAVWSLKPTGMPDMPLMITAVSKP